MEITDRKQPEQHPPSSSSSIDLEPPAVGAAQIAKPLLLIVQMLYLLLIFVPAIVCSMIASFFMKPKSLKGKVVLITGSGRGLGHGFAMRFAQLGCRIACVDINETINQRTASAINAEYGADIARAYTCNVGLSDQVRALRHRVLRDFGHLDILVHNAGLIGGTPSITDFDDIYLHGIVTTNLCSHFFMIREFLPDMIKRNQGHIVAVASLAGFFGIAKGSMYVATKHGLIGLMESLHYELQEIPDNKIQTSVVCPYFVNTSAVYNSFWQLRIPELSIERVINDAVAGIRMNTRIITSPVGVYYLAMISKLLPDYLNRAIRDVFYIKLKVPSMEFQKKLPLYNLLLTSFKKFKLEFNEF